MIFQANIDNDSGALLPAARFSGRVVVVDRDEMVDAACDDLQRFERRQDQRQVYRQVSSFELSISPAAPSRAAF